MKPRTLLVLLVVVLALGAFIQFYEKKLPSSEERAKLGNRVLGVEKDDIQAIEIVRHGQTPQTVRLERVPAAKKKENEKGDAQGTEPDASNPADSEWRLTQPKAARADSSAASGLAESLAGLARTRTLEHPDLKAVGLDPPQTTIRLATAKGAKVIKIGAKVPTGSEVIVGIEGDRNAYVTSDAILSSLEKNPGDWRDRQLLGTDRETIDRITLQGPAGTTVLARKGDGFEIESPAAERDRADRDLVEGLLTDLTGLHAQTFLDDGKETPAALGLEPPRGTVQVARRTGPPARIEIGGPAPAAPASPAPNPDSPPPSPAAPDIYARVDGQAVQAQTGLAADVSRAPADWRSRALSRFQVYQVESARITDGTGTVTVERSGTDWKRGKDTISYTPVSDLLFAVAGGKAEKVLSPAEAKALNLGKPLVTVVLKAEKSGGEETVTFYPPGGVGGGGAPVQTSGRDALLLLPSDKLSEVQKQIAAIRGAAPLPPEKPVATGKAKK